MGLELRRSVNRGRFPHSSLATWLGFFAQRAMQRARQPWRRGAMVLINRLRKGPVHESTSGDVKSLPDFTAPADLDGATATAQLQKDLLAEKQFRSMEQAQAAARDVRGEYFCLNRFQIWCGRRRKHYGDCASTKGRARTSSMQLITSRLGTAGRLRVEQ